MLFWLPYQALLLVFLLPLSSIPHTPSSSLQSYKLESVGAVILYTYVFNMLAPPPEGTFDIDDESLPLKSTPENDDSSPEQVPLLTQKEDVTIIDPNASKKWMIEDLLAFLYEKLKLEQILQPPIIASILAMVLGAVPFLKRLIFTADAPLFFFTDRRQLHYSWLWSFKF